MKKISLKKVTAIIIIVLIGSYLVHYFHGYSKFIQNETLWSHIDPRIFELGEEQILGKHFDIENIQAFMLRGYEEHVKHYWESAFIAFEPIKNYQSLLDEDTYPVPKIAFYFREEYCPVRQKSFMIFEKFSVNYCFLWASLNHSYPKDGDGLTAEFIEQAKEALNNTQKAFQENYLDKMDGIGSHIKKEFPNCQYTETEIKSLFSFSFPCIILNRFMFDGCGNLPAAERQKQREWLGYQVQMGNHSWLHVYADYFYQAGWWYFFIETIKYRLWLVGMYLAIIFCFFHLIRRDAALIVREELYKLGVTMNRRMIWRIILSNWHFFVLPASDAKMRPVIAKACKAIHERQQDLMLRKQAGLICDRCQDLKDWPSLIVDYRITSGISKKTSLAKRQRALIRLMEGEQQLRSRHQYCKPLVIINDDKPIKIKRFAPTQSNREKALELVRGLIPEGIAVALDALSSEKLERLAIVISAISSWHPEAVKTLLEKNNLNALLTKSKLLDAALAGDRTIVLKELGLLEKKVSKIKDIIIAEYSDILSSISVLVIGGERTEAKKSEIYEALADLGAAGCRIVSTDDRRKIIDAVQFGKELVVYVATNNSHGTRDLLDKAGVRYLLVNHLNRERFTRELIVQFQKTLSE